MGFKDKAIGVLEKQLTKQAMVLEVRAWEANTFFEIDLHVPDADFSNNNGVWHMKCRVASLAFRDYTVAGWDASTKTCTLLVDAGHIGLGSNWVKTVCKINNIGYLKIEQHRYPAMSHGNYLFLGDQSAIGHFLALRQLNVGNENISGALIIPDSNHSHQLKCFYPGLGLQSIPLRYSHSQSMLNWLQQQDALNYDGICLAGNTAMVITARHYLKQCGVPRHKIKAEGFWK